LVKGRGLALGLSGRGAYGGSGTVGGTEESLWLRVGEPKAECKTMLSIPLAVIESRQVARLSWAKGMNPMPAEMMKE
jgi:hypothetical protein